MEIRQTPDERRKCGSVYWTYARILLLARFVADNLRHRQRSIKLNEHWTTLFAFICSPPHAGVGEDILGKERSSQKSTSTTRQLRQPVVHIDNPWRFALGGYSSGHVSSIQRISNPLLLLWTERTSATLSLASSVTEHDGIETINFTDKNFTDSPYVYAASFRAAGSWSAYDTSTA